MATVRSSRVLFGEEGCANSAVKRCEIPHEPNRLMALCLIASASAAAQSAPSLPQPGPDALKCAALAELSLEDDSGGRLSYLNIWLTCPQVVWISQSP